MVTGARKKLPANQEETLSRTAARKAHPLEAGRDRKRGGGLVAEEEGKQSDA